MDIYAIQDLNGYASQMRDFAAKSLYEHYTDNLDEFISIDQTISLVKSECLGFDENNRLLLDEDTNDKIFESISTWIYNVGLAKLAARDKLECAWDEKLNEMVFWAKIDKSKQCQQNKKKKKKK